jgi:hypothetical protein
MRNGDSRFMMMQNCLNCLFWNAFRQDCHGNVCSTSERLSARLSMDLTATQSLLTTKKRLMSLCPLPESFAIEQKSRQRYLTLQFSSLFRKNLVRLMHIFQACVPKSLFSTIRPQPPQFQMPCQPTCVNGA